METKTLTCIGRNSYIFTSPGEAVETPAVETPGQVEIHHLTGPSGTTLTFLEKTSAPDSKGQQDATKCSPEDGSGSGLS